MSARILAIDTAAEYGSISLVDDEVLLQAPDGFGGLIFHEISRVLERAGLRLDELDGFAAASGPGSFTGVRIGLACVKGLAEATGKAAFGVSTLATLARFGSAERRVPVIDARRGEVYAGLYDASGKPLAPEVVCSFGKFVGQLPDGPVEFISQDFRPFAAELAGSRFAESPVVTAPRAIASMVARIAAERMHAGESGEPAGLDANYVRRSDAELLFKPW